MLPVDKLCSAFASFPHCRRDLNSYTVDCNKYKRSIKDCDYRFSFLQQRVGDEKLDEKLLDHYMQLLSRKKLLVV